MKLKQLRREKIHKCRLEGRARFPREQYVPALVVLTNDMR
jgi:hypothetical protein